MQINKVNANEAYIVIKGHRVFFSVEDIPTVQKYTWHVTTNGYCKTCVNKVHLSMQEILFGRKTNYQWAFHHKSTEKLDNRRCNLKFCHCIRNLAERNLSSNTGTSGIYWNGYSYRVRDHYTGKHRSFREYETALLYNILNYVIKTGDFEDSIDFFGLDCSEEEKELLRHTLLLTHIQQAQELEKTG